jgi:hypothetical protein
MGLLVRGIRGLGIAGLVLAGVFLASAVVPFGSDGVAFAQSASSIAVEGNRRVEAETIRSYFKPGPDGRIGGANASLTLPFDCARRSQSNGIRVVEVSNR